LNKLFEILNRANKRYKLSWNPGGRELGLLKNRQLEIAQIPCEVFAVNREEWNILEGVRDQILTNVPQVVITDGSKGCEIIIKGFSKHFDTKKVDSVDDTGAGDAFITAYVAAQLRGELPETAVKWAIANSTSVIQNVGAKPGLLRLGDMEKLQNVQ
ncbi:carbohydrate kinase family protein, partial [Candidatus Woesebacteria bacterium]|nr:carbohydrate kinase family protein [Candidatus Woesebacteria bacterium]